MEKSDEQSVEEYSDPATEGTVTSRIGKKLTEEDMRRIRNHIHESLDEFFEFTLGTMPARMKTERDLDRDTIEAEVFTRLFDAWSDIKDSTHAIAWFKRVTKNYLIDESRKWNAHGRGDIEVVDLPQGDIAERNECSNYQRRKVRLEKAINRLEQEDKVLHDIIRLVFMCGETREAAGLLLGMSPESVKRRIKRATVWLASQGRIDDETTES